MMRRIFLIAFVLAFSLTLLVGLLGFFTGNPAQASFRDFPVASNDPAYPDFTPADLISSTKTVTPTKAWVGEILSYEIRLVNSAITVTPNLSMRDLIPEYTKYVIGSLEVHNAGSAGYDPVTKALLWFGSIPGKTIAIVRFKVEVTSSPGNGYNLINTAAVGFLGKSPFMELQATTVILNNAGIAISSAPPQIGDPGQQVIFTHTVTNTGNFTDTFTFQASPSSGWQVTLPPTITLAISGTFVLPVTVTVPGNAFANTQGTVIVTSTSSTSPGTYADVTDLVTVNQVAGLDVMGASPINGAPGSVLIYTHTLTNQGNGSDTFLLGASNGAGWSVSFSQNPGLSPGETGKFQVLVNIPENAPVGVVTTTTITVTSSVDSAVWQSLLDTSVVSPPVLQLFLPLISNLP